MSDQVPSRFQATIDTLMSIAANCNESEFQKNKDYKKFKANRSIKPRPDIECILLGFRGLRQSYNKYFLEEILYWNKRILEEKVGYKENVRCAFITLIVLCKSNWPITRCKLPF